MKEMKIFMLSLNCDNVPCCDVEFMYDINLTTINNNNNND